jgi:broad specificity phosphatase PhoE
VELFLVRHGETLWNAEHRFQGQTDVPLSLRGRAQAAAIASALSSIPFSRAYASDLRRAVDTAKAVVADRRLDVETDARLREFNFGAWEGLTWSQIVARWPELEERFPAKASDYNPAGGERFEHIIERVRAFFADLRSSVLTGHVLIATHAGVLHATMQILAPEGFDPLGMVFSTGSITRVAMDGGRSRIITLNDVSHLDSIA